MKYWGVQLDAIAAKMAHPRLDNGRREKLAIWMSKLKAASARQAVVARRRAAVLGADSALMHSEPNTLLRTVLAHVADTAAATMTANNKR